MELTYLQAQCESWRRREKKKRVTTKTWYSLPSLSLSLCRSVPLLHTHTCTQSHSPYSLIILVWSASSLLRLLKLKSRHLETRRFNHPRAARCTAAGSRTPCFTFWFWFSRRDEYCFSAETPWGSAAPGLYLVGSCEISARLILPPYCCCRTPPERHRILLLELIRGCQSGCVTQEGMFALCHVDFSSPACCSFWMHLKMFLLSKCDRHKLKKYEKWLELSLCFWTVLLRPKYKHQKKEEM